VLPFRENDRGTRERLARRRRNPKFAGDEALRPIDQNTIASDKAYNEEALKC